MVGTSGRQINSLSGIEAEGIRLSGNYEQAEMADNCKQNARKMHGTRATPVIRVVPSFPYLSDTADSSLASDSPYEQTRDEVAR